ncbi:MAG: hypothetical protein GXN93_03630 [Candidatus Diapherotrites archaeon]|nr:hypothetical protein [Candidatus Diapherotrites archaeon]
MSFINGASLMTIFCTWTYLLPTVRIFYVIDYDVVIIRHSEIALKSRPVRVRFEKILVNNLERQTGGKAKREAARIILKGGDWEKVGKVFGVKSYSPAIVVPAELDAMREAALSFYRGEKTFAVKAQRVTKDVPWTSPEINRLVGGYVKEKTGATVDLKNAELNIGIEIINGKAYVFRDVLSGPGGLPVGAAGRVLFLFSGGIDSPVAVWRLAKRGVHPTLLYVNTTGRTMEGLVYSVYERLAGWFPYLHFYVVDFPELAEQIIARIPEGYRQIVFKAALYRIADIVADELDIPAIATGEVLSQVSTQTLESLRVLHSFSSRPVFRPLISYDKDEIVAIARKIDTLDASERVPEVCTLSHHSVTAPRLEKVRKLLDSLDLDFTVARERLREAEHVNTDVLFSGQSLRGFRIISAEDAQDFTPTSSERYVIVCKTGSTAARIAEMWREKGIEAYALDERTYKRLIM